MKWWTVDVGRPFDSDDVLGEDEKFDVIAGRMSDAGGAGFGIRDLQYDGLSRKEAFRIGNKFAEMLGVEVNAPMTPISTMEQYTDQTGYVSVVFFPTNIVAYLIYARDWPELRRELADRIRLGP